MGESAGEGVLPHKTGFFLFRGDQSMRIVFEKQPNSKPKRKAFFGQKIDSTNGVFLVAVELQVEAFVCVPVLVSVCIVICVYFLS